MLAIVLLGLIACENAVSFKFRRVNDNHDNFYTERDNQKMGVLNSRKAHIISREENINNEIMKINRQQQELNRQMENIKKQKDELQRETDFLTRQKDQLEREIETVDADIKLIKEHKRNHADGIIEGNEFKITIYLSGFKEEDIVVKSKKGRLIVQAIQNVPGELTNNYYNVSSLPDFVEGNGRWLYMRGVLQIVFPIIRQNKYAKPTIPFDNEEFNKAGNGKPNNTASLVASNFANNITKRTFLNSASMNNTINTDVSNQEFKKKAMYVSNQEDHVEAITDNLINSDNVKVINNITNRENAEEVKSREYRSN